MVFVKVKYWRQKWNIEGKNETYETYVSFIQSYSNQMVMDRNETLKQKWTKL